eukprot:gene5707-9527_t
MNSAIDKFDEIFSQKTEQKELILFLDYDGTLSPIVSKPELAVIDEKRRNIIQKLSQKYLTSIVSGRAKEDVKKRVSVDNCYYAGSHGFDITTPENKQLKFAEEYIPILKKVYDELCIELKSYEGVILENNIFTLSVHYRLVKETKDFEEIEKIVKMKLNENEKIKLTNGKKVFEFRPNFEWHKGKALVKLLELMKKKNSDIFCIYIGDDKTDEDAFKVLKDLNIGIGIFVGDSNNSNTHASFSLKDPNEVELFLQKLI